VLVPDSQFPRLSQHPLGQLEALHVAPWQDPALHMSPGGQGTQALPPLPHAIELLPGSQTPVMLQQPVGHVAALQGGGWQVPAGQLSPGGHAAHRLPPLPHALVLVPISQKPSASQHPVGHVEGSHGGPLHSPAEQESAGGHGKQAWPPVPHANMLLPGSQFPRPSQQPFGQLEALQVIPWQEPALQLSPGGQGMHARPSLPQDVVLLPGSQIPAALQQPVGHVAELHGWISQMPPRQRSSGGHAAQALPPLPQAVGLVPGSQNPRGSQQPVGHVEALHDGPTHTPPEQESAGGQGKHAPPPFPHAVVLVPDSQIPELSQQPVGQLVGLQVTPWQAPALQVSPGGQGVQASPPLPHEPVLVPDSQIPAVSQHPVGQVAALQGMAWQAWVAGLQTRPLPSQFRQRDPSSPQARSSRPPTHFRPPAPFAWQQPLGHVVASHPTCTPTQAWAPGSHEVKPSAGQSSQTCPSSPHAVVAVPLWQWSVESQQPLGHVLALQAPGPTQVREAALQLSSAGQAVHRLPAPPHAAFDVPATQAPSAVQHPVRQVDALQAAPSFTGPSTEASNPEP
jgi:hypothetical protein